MKAEAAVALALSLAVVPAAPSPVPQPPPVQVSPPAGRAPGPAPGLRVPDSCPAPVPGDASADAPGAAALRLDAVHALATGTGQRIAVIDTGVTPHPRLAGRLRGGGDYLQGADGLDDCDGHGTAVAGLLAAAPGPDDSVVGMAPGAELLSIRQSSTLFRVPGPGGTLRPAGDTDTLAAAIVLAVRQRATVINISEAACLPAAAAARAGRSLQAALRYAAESDVVVVAAAGNAGSGGCAEGDGPLVSLPGWYDADLLTVAATEPDGTPAPFSIPGPWVDVAAPGTGLRSLAVGRGLTGPDVQGTSFATPWVAGLAALLRERFPQLTAREVADRIVATARRPATGVDPAVGHGAIDPLAALTAEPLRLSPGAMTARPTAALPGVGAAPADTTSPGGPAGLLGVAVLLGAVAVAVRRLRVSPRLAPAPAPRRPPGAPPPGPVPARPGAAAGPPPGPGRRG